MTKSKDPYSVSDLVDFLIEYSLANPGSTKQEILLATVTRFDLEKHRKVYVSPNFAVRFSSAQGSSFSNTVLSLSALEAIDDRPFVVCIVRPTRVELLLANSTLLKKVSHSSQAFRADNIRGSFLGHDILRSFSGLENIPANFQELFSYHQAFSWQENVERLAEATSSIVATGIRFSPSEAEIDTIFSSVDLARRLSSYPEYLAIEDKLKQTVQEKSAEILSAAAVDIDNINHRGNKIEQLMTETGNIHGLGDMSFLLEVGATVLVDVKTKMITLASSPKGYNVEKLLRTLAAGRTVFSFFFIGIDLPARRTYGRLVSILDRTILAATKVQFHWAGRNSRGVTQLAGDLSMIFSPTFSEDIDTVSAKEFLKMLIDLKVVDSR